MQITVLGSGSAIQFENRGSASYLVEACGKKILLDAGFYLLDRLEKSDIMADEIDAVFISHKHPDHFMGLIHMLFALKNKYYTKKDKLTIFGFKGLSDWIDSFRNLLGKWIEPGINIEIIEQNGQIDGIKWELFKTVHSPESTGIVLKAEGKKLVYTGDTGFFDGLADISYGADLLIADCGSGNSKRIKGHMCLDDILYIAENSNIRNIILSHIYPETDSTEPVWSHRDTRFMRTYDLHKISL